MDVVMPAAEIGGAFLARALHDPGFDTPVALHDADEVEDLAAAQKIVDDVAAGADPVDPDIAAHVRRQPFSPAPARATPCSR